MSERIRAMSCDEFDALLDLGNPFDQSDEARQHLQECPRCRELAAAFGGGRGESLPASALAKAQTAALRDLTPVRPLSSPFVAASGTLVALACVILASLLLYGSHGWAARLPWQRASSYLGAGSVLVLSLAAALRERVPGSSLPAPWRYAVAALATLVWTGPFMLYQFQPETRFWPHGAACCCNGLLVGVVSGMVIWLALRRGYLLSPLRTGWFAGVAAGCLAFIVQETYCPVVESGHSALWHGGVVAILGTAGLLMGWRALRSE